MENTPQTETGYMNGRPTKRQQSYGAIISIIIIVAVIVVGAFYTWGKRLAKDEAAAAQSTTQTAAVGEVEISE